MPAQEKPHVAIVGGGLVGALNACFMAKRGFIVDVYERRADIRKMAIVKGRSINLALSERGRAALREVGLEDVVTAEGIPMHARMIHNKDGTTSPIPYGQKHQYIMSVDRRKLNEVLLTQAEKQDNVRLYFDHKLIKCDFDNASMVFQRKDGSEHKTKVDLIIGNDGAFSAVRQNMMKNTLLDFQQQYIPHGYMELTVTPNADGEFAMPINYLHIWPRNEYMMIALPNQDKSFTATLFMPFEIFDSIKTEEQVLNFFQEKFPDSIPLIGEDALKKTYTSSKALPMVSIKCSPYHYKDKAVILGDAAHAMVPFYGQGMNAGFEDCLVLKDFLDKHNNNFAKALKEFSEFRAVDAHSICELAMYNYIEMRKSVNSRMFRLRKKLDNFLYAIFPNTWIPLYTMVSFSRIRYHECIQKRKMQDELLSRCVQYGTLLTGVSAAFILYQACKNGGVIDKVHSCLEKFTNKH